MLPAARVLAAGLLVNREALPYAAGGSARIGRELVVGHGIIHDGGQLIVNGLEICLGKRVPGFITVGYQFRSLNVIKSFYLLLSFLLIPQASFARFFAG